LSEALRGLSRAEGVTMFMTLIAGLTVVLAQRIGQRDFLVGTVVANRNLEAIEGLVGCFVNQIPLRAELSERDTFRVLLRRTREGALAAYDHADLPFDLLVKALQLPRDLSRAPLVQIQLVMQQPASVPPLAGGLTLSAVPPPLERLHNDLEISMNDDASMHGVAHYSTALYDESTVADLLDDFCALLREAAARPESEVEALFGILEAAERDRRRARTDARLQADRQQLQQYARRG
jgi:non-ribosomal peptide synthetase component F